LLSNRRYVLYLASRVSLVIATQMLSVAVGQQVWKITGKASALGISGLVLFLPIFLLTLVGGHVADVFDRRKILLVCHLGFAAASALLGVMAFTNVRRVAAIYAVLVVIGVVRAFSSPAGQALMPNLVERNELERAVALSSSSWQLAMIAGPSLAGVLYAATGGAGAVYFTCSAMALIAFATMFGVGALPKRETSTTARPPASLATLFAGIRYIWSNKPILGAISLDLFAVLLGGATALLPIFADKVLHVDVWGFGILRSAPAVGAATVALILAYHPLRRHAGAVMLGCVAFYGIATIVFGTSKNFGLSLVTLVILGAFDMFSVVIRASLIQIRTPDEMRGRVGAVNQVFIGASNELGEFESGLTAAWLGPVWAVVAGGIGTLLVVITWSLAFPDLRKVDRFDVAPDS